jgi:gluconolactonase
MDEFGNLYISNGRGVMVFNPKGENILTINVGRGGATNNVFAGLNEKTLFITGPSDRVTKIPMNVKGVERFGGEHNGQIKDDDDE